jgi:hypothetical protein
MEAEDLVKRDQAREASAREWTERAQGRSGATKPVPRSGYSIDPQADGNERTDDMIPVLGPDEALVHAHRSARAWYVAQTSRRPTVAKSLSSLSGTSRSTRGNRACSSTAHVP